MKKIDKQISSSDRYVFGSSNPREQFRKNVRALPEKHCIPFRDMIGIILVSIVLTLGLWALICPDEDTRQKYKQRNPQETTIQGFIPMPAGLPSIYY